MAFARTVMNIFRCRVIWKIVIIRVQISNGDRRDVEATNLGNPCITQFFPETTWPSWRWSMIRFTTLVDMRFFLPSILSLVTCQTVNSPPIWVAACGCQMQQMHWNHGYMKVSNGFFKLTMAQMLWFPHLSSLVFTLPSDRPLFLDSSMGIFHKEAIAARCYVCSPPSTTSPWIPSVAWQCPTCQMSQMLAKTQNLVPLRLCETLRPPKPCLNPLANICARQCGKSQSHKLPFSRA